MAVREAAERPVARMDVQRDALITTYSKPRTIANFGASSGLATVVPPILKARPNEATILVPTVSSAVTPNPAVQD